MKYFNFNLRNFIFIALCLSLFYNDAMKTFYLIIAHAFLGIWGLGILFGFFEGVKRTKFSDPAREQVQNMSTATWKEQKKFMEDFQYQNERYKQTLPKYPTTKF